MHVVWRQSLFCRFVFFFLFNCSQRGCVQMYRTNIVKLWTLAQFTSKGITQHPCPNQIEYPLLHTEVVCCLINQISQCMPLHWLFKCFESHSYIVAANTVYVSKLRIIIIVIIVGSYIALYTVVHSLKALHNVEGEFRPLRVVTARELVFLKGFFHIHLQIIEMGPTLNIWFTFVLFSNGCYYINNQQ